MRCSACGGPFHPATGHQHSTRTRLCGPCARSFVTWVRNHTRRRSSGCDFYSAAATSVRALAR